MIFIQVINWLRLAAFTVARPFIAFKKKMPLFSYIIGRFFLMLAMLFVLGFGIFGLMALIPGDIVSQVMMQQLLTGDGSPMAAEITAEWAEQMRSELGLDQPFYVQYFRWLRNVLVYRDLGVSLITQAPVSFLIASRLANTVVLALINLTMVTVFSFLLGVYFSSKAGKNSDLAIQFIALCFHSFPGMLFLILAQMFAAATGWFPLTAFPHFTFASDPLAFIFAYIHFTFLPLFSMFLMGVGGTLRRVRAAMLDELGKPYIIALRSRGIAEWRVYLCHAFRNTLNPYIISMATMLGAIFGGALIFEIIFAYPGMGQLIFAAVRQQDVNLAMASLMVISALNLIGMLISDILVAVIDPRVRYGKED